MVIYHELEFANIRPRTLNQESINKPPHRPHR